MKLDFDFWKSDRVHVPVLVLIYKKHLRQKIED